MTVSSIAASTTQIGNGITTTWPFAFAIPGATPTDQTNVVVTIVDTTVTPALTTVVPSGQFSVTGISTPAVPSSAGSVTYPLVGSPLLAGQYITIQRVLPVTQSVSLPNQGGYFPKVVEGEFDYLTELIQQLSGQVQRSLQVAVSDPGGIPAVLPPSATRANTFLGFDALGNPTALAALAGSTPISAAMAGFVSAATLAAARTILGLASGAITTVGTLATQNANAVAITGGSITGPINLWTNTRLAKTAAYALANGDKGSTIALSGGATYALTVATASGFDANFLCMIVNEDTANAKSIQISGYSAFLLWPGQSLTLYATNNVWRFIRPTRWAVGAGAGPTIFVSPTGSDANDGLTVSNPLQHIAAAVQMANGQIDWMASNAVNIQLAAGTYIESILHTYNLSGANEINFIGNPASPSSVIWQAGANHYCLAARDCGIASVNGIKFQGSVAGDTGLNPSQWGVIDVSNFEFGAFPGGQCILINDGGAMNITIGTLVIDGPMNYFMLVQGIAKVDIVLTGITTVLPNALTFTAFINITGPGLVSFAGAYAFSGAGSGAGSTGVKYQVSLNGVLILNGTTLPGASAGTFATGGQVSP
jgi:hypothetical protein